MSPQALGELISWLSEQIGVDERGAKARRLIVDEVIPGLLANDEPGIAEESARTVAAKYADRPGYREEWRP